MAKNYDINWDKVKKEIKKIEPMLAELKKLNDALDTVMAEKMYKNFQTVGSLKFYNTICGHINNNHDWYKKLVAWNEKMVSIASTAKYHK